MVCIVGSVEDFYKSLPRNPELERIVKEIVSRRDHIFNMLFDHDYFHVFTTEDLPDQVLLVNGLALEASRLDDRYRAFSGKNESDPNYDQLQYMLQGAKRVIISEIHHRANSGA